MNNPRVTQAISDLDPNAVHEIEEQLRLLLADTFALYVKTKSCHWHMRGRHFHDFHLLLDDQADKIFAITDQIAERARKLGGTTLRSVADISRHQRLRDNEQQDLPPREMLDDLLSDNRQFVRFLRSTHDVCDRNRDVATASLVEVWIDDAERRAWFLGEITGDSESESLR